MCCLKYFWYQLEIFLDALYRKYKTGSFAPPALSLGGEGSLGLGPLSLGGKVGFGAGGYPGEGDTRCAISVLWKYFHDVRQILREPGG